MRHKSFRRTIVAGLLFGALGGLSVYAAGPKSGGIITVIDDLTTGAAGSVGLSSGPYLVSGSVGQAARAFGAGIAFVESGYFAFGGNGVSGAPFSAIGDNTLTANWISGFAAGTPFTVELSTGGFPNAFAGNLSTTTVNLSFAFTGLSPATLYFARLSTDSATGPYLNLGSTVTTGGAAGALAALAYTNVYANGLTANWSTTFPAGTAYYVQLSTDNFSTINSSNTTTNPSFVYNGLNASTGYYVRVSTSSSGGSFTSLGLVNTPAPAVAAVNFNFTGGAAAATIASGNGQNESGVGVVVDTVSANGPFVYVMFESTTGATGEASSFHALAKYGPGGAVLSSRTLVSPNAAGAMALDGSGNLYVGEKDTVAGTRWISKYDANLVLQTSVAVVPAHVGKITAMASDGLFLYTVNDSGPDNSAKVIKYASNLVALATASYALGGGSVQGDAIVLDPSGNVYVAVSSSTPGAPKRLLKYPAAFNGASPSFDVLVPGLAGSQTAELAFSAGKLFAGFPDAAGTSYVVRQFDSSLNYNGVSSTMTGVALNAGGGIRGGPDASVFVGSTFDGGDGGDYLVTKLNANNNLAFMSSATFNSPTFLMDRARSLAVLSSTMVYVTGSSSNTIADANAVTSRLTLSSGGGGACAAPISAGGPFTGVSTNSLTANWTPEPTCPAGTVLTAMISPAPFSLGTIIATVTTSGSFAAFSGLTPGTSYTVVVSTTGQFAGGLAIGPAFTLNTAALSISGLLTYAGFEPGAIRLEAFTSPAFTGLVSSQVLSNVPSSAYYLTVGAGTYYLRAYVDVFGDGAPQPWADRGTLSGVVVAASSVTGQNFSIAVDSIAPNSPVGLAAVPGAGQVNLSWAAPTTSTNGAVLQDLRGYVVQRSTAGVFVNLAGTPATPISSATLSFVDFAPVPTVANAYRVIAVDFERNQSAPSGQATVAAGGASAGGTISGRISTFTTTTSGVFRVRLSTPGGVALSESNQNPYSFPGLSSGTYFLKAFRDLDNDGAQGSLEPAGTAGGLHGNPFPIYISGGNSVTADATVCDRSLLQVGPQLSATLTTDGCPASEAGPGRVTNPLVFEAGTAAATSVALNSPLVINMSRLASGSVFFDSQLLVIGPGGQIVASNSSPGGAAVSFTPAQAGAYVVLPTSFLSNSTGTYTLRMSSASSGSDPGQINGSLVYGGAQSGGFVMRFFNSDNSSFAGIPVATQNVAAAAGPGTFAFNRVSLPLGTYFVDAFRDTGGSGVYNASYQAYGRCNAGAGVTLAAGSPAVGIGNCAVADPSAAAGGGASISGAASYSGALTGVLRTSLFPRGSNSPVASTSAAMTPSVPAAFSFTSLSSGTYILKSFLDGNANFVPDAGEAVIASTATGIAVLAGASVTGQNLILCDRRPIVSGTPITDSWTLADCRGPDRGGAFTRMYTFSGKGGEPVTIEASAIGFYGTFIALYDADGNLAASDDGGNASGNAKLSNFVLPVDGLYTIGASPYAANVTGQIRLSLIGSGGALGSIAGSVNYTGSQGGDLIAGLFSSASFSSSTQVGFVSVSSASAFRFDGLATGTTYFLGAFVDVNFNLLPDSGEDKAHFGAGTSPSPVLLSPGQNLGGVNILVSPSTTVVGGGAYVSGLIGYKGGQSIGSSGQLRVEFWPDSLFTGNPIAIRSLPNGTTPYAYDMTAPGGQSYFIRAYLDVDNDQILDTNEPKGVYSPHNQGAEPLFVPLSANIVGADFSIVDPFAVGGNTSTVAGEGTAAISVSTLGAGALFSAAIVYTAGPGGIQPSGRIGFVVPEGFSLPQNVTVTPLTGTAVYAPVVLSGPSASVKVNSGSLAAGQQMRFNYVSAIAPCVVSSNIFTVVSASTGSVPPAPLFSLSASTLSVAVLPGAPARFAPVNAYVSLTQYELSPSQSLEARDACGNRAALTGAATASLRAKSFDYQAGQFADDAAVGLTASPALPTAASLDQTFAAGQSSSAFYVVSTATGAKNIELFYNLGVETTFYYGFTVLPSNALTNVSVSTTAAGVTGSSATISFSLAYLHFTLGDTNVSWHVTISSVPYRDRVAPTPLWETWGQGQPGPSQVVWDGRFSPWINGGARVPGGRYYVRVEVGGSGVHDDSVSIGVDAPQLAGRFFDAGVQPSPPLGGARLQLYGPEGTIFTQTDAQGGYVLPGVAAGSYQMAVSRSDFLDGNLSLTVGAAGAVSTFTALTNSVSASTNASSGLDVFMNRPAILLVSPALVGFSTQAFDQWGSLQVRPASTSSVIAPVFGPLRLAAGTTTFDDGGQWDPSTQQFSVRTQLRFSVAVGTYTAEASLGGFAVSSASVYVGQGVTVLNLPAFTRKSTVSGLVSVPANPSGVFVSVNASPVSSSTLLTGGFGGVFLPIGVLSSTYTIANLDAGSYLLRANTQGFSAISSGPITVPASSDVAGVNFPAFSAGSVISGNATINADTTGRNLQLSVNAWSPGSLNFGSTVVYTAGGAAGLVIPYSIAGLNAGLSYEVYANLIGSEGLNLNVSQGQPIIQAAPATLNFGFNASSGVISGSILLPAGATDFLNVSLFGETVASMRPENVGQQFSVATSTKLPGFACSANGLADVLGYCPVGNSSAAFTIQGLNTETNDITFFYRTTGQTKKIRVSVVNGSTSTVTADLRPQTFSVSGAINNQITHTLFNTNPNIAANAPLIAPVGYPAGLSSTTARVVAIPQDIASFRVAISTTFDPATTRIGFLSSAGTYTITGLPAGIYFVRTTDLRACATCAVLVPSVGRIVTVAGVSVSSVDFTLTDGFAIAGAVSLDGGLQDAQVFTLSVLNRRQEVVRSTTVYLGDSSLGVSANSVDYLFTNIPAGEFYTLSAASLDGKYVGPPVQFPDPALSPSGLRSNLIDQNLVMKRAAYFTGKLKDANTGALITSNNAVLLAPNFAISATATPWTPGGFSVAPSSVAGRPIQADGAFRLGPVLPGVTYNVKLAQTSWDPAFLSRGSQNYAPVNIAGAALQPGEVRDLGVISLNQGQSLTGTVRQSTTTGALLGNIKITAAPSFGASDVLVQTYTDSAGRYTVWVSSFISNQYDVTAAPRDGNVASNGSVYTQVTRRNVNLQASTTADFLLDPLLAAVTGQVVVADAATGGVLSYPFGETKGFPAAAINLQLKDVIPTRNPLGDLETTTDQEGRFSLVGLTTGTYSLKATSLGYGVFNGTVTASTSTFAIYTGSNTPANYLAGSVITLSRGATVTGRILKSDGSAPNDTEVGGVAAANFGSDEFVVGTVETDPVAKTVNAYTISGFKPGISYDLVILPADKRDDVILPPEGAAVSFTASESTSTRNVNLTFLNAGIDCVADSKALGNSQFQLKIDCTLALRNESLADNDLNLILAASTFSSVGSPLASPNGTGQFLGSDKSLSKDRKQITAVYRAATGETRFSVRIRASASAIDPRTGSRFAVDRTFDFYTGLDSNVSDRISNINGGSVVLTPSAQDEFLLQDERSRVDLPPGVFAEGSDNLADAGVVAQATTTVRLSLSKGRDQNTAKTLSLAARGYAPASLEVADNPSSFPAEMWAAMSTYRTLASTTSVGGANPLSAYYSIFLPAGIRHQLKERADLTLSYSLAASTSTTDDKIQIYFYNAVLGRFVPETTNRRLDTVNKTVTVSVDHFSTFVVLDSTPVATAPVSFGGADIAVANFPNPADCIVHSNIARNSTLFGAGGVHAPFVGTMFRASIPLTGTPAELKYNIYNVAGEKIRTIEQGVVPVGQTYYTPWNCSNDNGETVSSGVYIGEVIHGGRSKFFKIAIIKGSGL